MEAMDMGIRGAWGAPGLGGSRWLWEVRLIDALGFGVSGGDI